MKHWLGVLIVAAVLGGIGLLIQPDETSAINTAGRVRGGLLALAVILGLIAALKIASELMKTDRHQNQ